MVVETRATQGAGLSIESNLGFSDMWTEGARDQTFVEKTTLSTHSPSCATLCQEGQTQDVKQLKGAKTDAKSRSLFAQ
ncbi:hypothetical protein EYF80_031721 [Liparis tanakae]|uniref:Uncharacterized protein n=1 Tax=Liparis tanakae TaxID=230148 RepID=A0A4Z2GX73_9TELE|nr:hypothetical protein EYF80_031721 [Liparis tanakae]